MLINIERCHELMERHGLDAVVATLPENVTYASGYASQSRYFRHGQQSYALIPAPGRGEPAIIVTTSSLDEMVSQSDVWIRRVYRYGFFLIEQANDLDSGDQRLMELCRLPDHGTPLDALCAALTDSGLATATIGVDEFGLLPGYFGKLGELLPKATIRPAAELFRQIRAVKTEEEIRRLRRAAWIAEESIASALEVAKPGVIERELGLAFHGRTVREGAHPVLGSIGSGPGSAMIHAEPGDRRLQSGDVIRFDVGGRYRHYLADVARVATLGEPSARVRQYHRALHVGVLTAFEMIRPGVRASDVFDKVVQSVRREGIPHYQRGHVGHGIGIEGYDVPNLSPSSDAVIEEGMTLCIETPYYEIGSYGLQVEDMVIVRRDGVESMMSTDGGLKVLPC